MLRNNVDIEVREAHGDVVDNVARVATGRGVSSLFEEDN